MYRSATPDGRNYKLNRLKVQVCTQAEDNPGGYVNIPVFSDKGNYVLLYCDFQGGERRDMSFELWKEDGIWDAVETISSQLNYSLLGVVANHYNDYLHRPNGAYGDYISLVNINIPLPAGTIVNIYGRWEKDA